jgi:hypothetical protein
LGSGCRDGREKGGRGEEEERRRDGETWKTHVVVSSRLRCACVCAVCARPSARLLVWSGIYRGDGQVWPRQVRTD